MSDNGKSVQSWATDTERMGKSEIREKGVWGNAWFQDTLDVEQSYDH
jgi:hypothetical protein